MFARAPTSLGKIPTSIKGALALDKEDGNDLWQKAYEKEIFQVGVAFNILKDNESIPAGHKQASGHILFTCKMDFTRKERWVKDSHLIPNLKNSKYASVVSCESVRITLKYATLHRITVLAADIRNAYLQAHTSENH